ncbi:hypothetical protein NW762_007931 [Fusarium torreyae]|uniref:Nephrocystin 3-like N-terminal domain-containing protein n=1 Tax=Fusarium torreyae TaxID=1237075 RepID=A0A9W8RWP8_9HYPO|nr:hypothetical protein NW762_007931 [Fusarium torreyae]
MPKSTNTADEYDFVDHEETALSPEIVAQLRDWLQPTDYLADSGEYRRHLSSQAPGTGLWICQTDEYRKWHDSPDHGSLWIKGVPGAGKSVMAASLIQHIRSTENCPVLFFFFRNIVAANFSPRALIQDWLAQLLPYSPKLQFALQPRLKTSLEETSDNDLIQIFLDGVSCVPKLYCVGDALDEMSTDNKPFLEKLNSLATHRPRSLKLLMTSRPKQYLQSTLRDSSIVHISLQQRLVDADITSYLNHRFEMAPKSDHYRQLKQEVIDMVAHKSEGLFLYAKLTMDQVEASLQSDNPVDIKVLGDSLPVGLEQTYTSMLAKQRGEPGITVDVQVLVLEAVTHASRPLRLNELASLLRCIRPDLTEPSCFKALIATCCGPLIEILEDETLQVIHHSFTEFLRGDTRSASATNRVSDFPLIDSQQAHKHMALNCLRYLESGSLMLESEKSATAAIDPSVTFKLPRHRFDFDARHYRREHLGIEDEYDPFEYKEARLQHPFLSYAVENWSYHASFYDVVDDEFFEAITDFLKPDSISFLRWLVLQWGSTSTSKESSDGLPSALHIAAFAGLSELALRLVQQGVSALALDAQERIPLHWAAYNGHAKLTSLLIQNGSDPDAADGRGLKPIHLAALKNHAAVITVLLEAGVKPDSIKTKEDHAGRLLGGAKVTQGECAILYASKAGHTETVMAMIPFCDRERLEQLLCECCRFGRTDAVLALLNESTVSANAMYRQATALYFACKQANLKCAEALIKRGADVTKTSQWIPRRQMYGGYDREIEMVAPIHELVSNWKEENNSACRAILRLLVEAGADLEQLNGSKNTALLVAAGVSTWYTHHSMCSPALKALLKEGANAKVIEQKEKNTVLHLVANQSRDLEAIKLLVEHGCDPNETNFNKETPLLCALIKTGASSTWPGDEGAEEIIKFFLDQGVDPCRPDKYGRTAVYRSMEMSVEIFKLLLSKCDNVAEKKRCWFGLSSENRIEKFTQRLELLLAEGIDIDTRRESDGRTLYLCCLSSDDKMRCLREHGANTDVCDAEGNNALHITCRDRPWSFDRLKDFVASGVDPLARNDDGNTLLHLVAPWYDAMPKTAEFVRWLVSLDIPVNAVNKNGATALHVYQTRDRLGSTLRGSFRIHFIDVLNTRGDVNFNIRDNDGLAPIHLAAMRSEIELANLVNAGADVNFLTSDSQHVLHVACRARKASIVGQILELSKTMDIHLDRQDWFKKTPLFYACCSGEPESVAFLIEYGADGYHTASDGLTLFHACADVGTEQNMWNARGRRSSWLRCPEVDPLRPETSLERRHKPWYQARYSTPFVTTRKEYSLAVGTIVKLLMEYGIDLTALDRGGYTALDLALYNNNAGFVEVFAQNEELFAQATSHLETLEDVGDRAEEMRRSIRTQMLLSQPRSRWDTFCEDEATFKDLLDKPNRYLGLLTTNDTAKLIDQSFKAAPLTASTYNLLERLMQPSALQNINHLAVIEKAPALVKYYSSYASVRTRFEKARVQEKYHSKPCKTSLGLVCSQKDSNLLTLKLLVEELQVEVNARFATHHGSCYSPGEEIVPGGTALHVLASADCYWQVEALRYLLDHGADPNAVDEDDKTPLHIAAVGPQHEDREYEGFWRVMAVKILLDHGADPNLLDDEELSPLHMAAAAPDVMRELLKRGADTTVGAKSPLFSAIFDQNLGALEILLDHGVSPDSVDETRHSRDIHYDLTRSRRLYAVLCAAFNEQINTAIEDTVPLLRTLIERGANLYLPLNEDETLIHFLFEYPVYKTVDALLEEPCASRIDFNRRDQRGRTVLMAACDWRESLPGSHRRPWEKPASAPPARMLDFGADSTLVDDEGKTALHHLLDNPGLPDDVPIEFINRPEVAPTLFLKDNEGYSPLHYALRLLRPGVCETLLSKGADLLEPDPKGRTALHFIAAQCIRVLRRPCCAGRLDIDLGKDFFDRCAILWNKFLAQGGSINAVDNEGNTPLHVYLSSEDGESHRRSEIETCHVHHYDKLFPEDSDIDIFAVNHAGETALHMVARKEHHLEEEHDKRLFVFMMEKGVDPLREDVKGRSALDVASACEKHGIVGLLGRK